MTYLLALLNLHLEANVISTGRLLAGGTSGSVCGGALKTKSAKQFHLKVEKIFSPPNISQKYAIKLPMSSDWVILDERHFPHSCDQTLLM